MKDPPPRLATADNKVSGASDPVVGFGIFELDLRRRELRRKGIKVSLQHQPFEILRLLVSHRGDFVSRDLIQQTLWPDGRFVDFERSINTAMMRLRQALRDSVEAPAYIETVPRTGYRLIAPVLGAAKDKSAEVMGIAILPLQDLSADEQPPHFIAGLTDALITEMACKSNLRVISRMTMERYRGSRQDLREIARELQVQAIVEGSFIRVDNRIRISARLLDASEDRHLWAQTYDRDLKDILFLQQELATAIVGSATRALGLASAPSPATRQMIPRAYENYLKGNYLLSLRTAASYDHAAECYQNAIDLDPGWGDPYAGLAEAYRSIDFNRQCYSHPAAERIIELARKAIELRPDHAAAHATLGAALSMHQWQWKSGQVCMDRALQLNPHSGTVQFLAGTMHFALGDFARAQHHFEKALSNEPSSRLYRSFLVQTLLFSDRRDEAAKESADILDHGEFFFGQLIHAAALIAVGRSGEALPVLDRAWANFRQPAALAVIVRAHIALRDLRQAALVQEQILSLYLTKSASATMVASGYAAQGDRTTALQFLQRALDEHDIHLPVYIRTPSFDSLRTAPQYLRIMESVFAQ